MPTLTKLLTSITRTEMSAARKAVIANHSEEKKRGELGAARSRIGDSYPAFLSMFDTGSINQERDDEMKKSILMRITGFQTAGEWLGFVAALRAKDDLSKALASITCREANDARDYFLSISVEDTLDYFEHLAKRNKWLLKAFGMANDFAFQGGEAVYFAMIHFFAIIIHIGLTRDEASK